MKLPGERELAEQYAVAYTTIRRAMEVLRDRGVIVTRQGRGTFVESHEVNPNAVVYLFDGVGPVSN